MTFLAQLDLSELAAVHHFAWLPLEGHLAFFYDTKNMPWGFDPKDRGKWRVVYIPTANAKIDFPEALATEARITHSYVVASKVDVFPDADCPAIEALNLSEEESDAYCDFRGSNPDGLPSHQVGGFPSPVQGNTMELECQLASNGVYVGDEKGYKTTRAKELEPGAKDWCLLLQLDSDDDLGFMWGDAGMIYFWIREEDAQAMRFEQCWLILQCC